MLDEIGIGGIKKQATTNGNLGYEECRDVNLDLQSRFLKFNNRKNKGCIMLWFVLVFLHTKNGCGIGCRVEP